MTCTCTELDVVVAAPKSSGLAGRLLSALNSFRPAPTLDLERLSAHQRRDLSLADGRAAGPRDWMLD
jgi:hypothetical protein